MSYAEVMRNFGEISAEVKKLGIDVKKDFSDPVVFHAMKAVCGFEKLMDGLMFFYFGYASTDCNESLADKILNQCESETSGKGCYDNVVKGTQEFCKFTSGKARPCKWLDNVVISTSSTSTLPTTTVGSSAPLIIGILIGVVSVLIIGIAIFFCCRRKKEPSVQEMNGVSVEGKKKKKGKKGKGSTTGSVSGEVKSTTKKTVSGY